MNSHQSWLSCAMRTSLGAAIFALLAFASSYLVFGSPVVALAYLRGERVIAVPRSFDVGLGADHEMKTATFRVRNYSGRELIITGANTNCTCIMPGEYPVRVASGGSRDVELQVRLSTKQPELSQVVTLYTDSPNQAAIPLRITGRVGMPRPQ